MWRTLFGMLLGFLIGAAAAAGLMWLTERWVRSLTYPKVFEIEHFVLYLGVILGAGFGAVCGALAGLASVVGVTRPTNPPTTPAPQTKPAAPSPPGGGPGTTPEAR